MSTLENELERLRIAMVRRLCERLEDPSETATPAYLDVARKMVADLMAPQPAAPRAEPVVWNLPFPGEDE
jgi:hypothetical protein